MHVSLLQNLIAAEVVCNRQLWLLHIPPGNQPDLPQLGLATWNL